MHMTKQLSLLLFLSLPSLVGASPTGIFNCFITYQPTHISPNTFSDGSWTCFNNLLIIDFDRKVARSTETCARLQGDWSYFNEVGDFSFSQTSNSPISGVTKVTATVDGVTNSLHFVSVNVGNSLLVQGADFPGSGICQRP